MEHRYLKMAFALTAGLQAIIWFGNNILNWETAQGAVAYALSQADHEGGYGNHLLPPITSPLVATLILLVVLAGEGSAGVLALWGAVRLWQSRNANAEVFTSAKRFAVLGSGIAFLVWFLLFAVLGGALLQMGQAPGLRPALDGAFKFAAYSVFTLIYLSLSEPESKGRGSAA